MKPTWKKVYGPPFDYAKQELRLCYGAADEAEAKAIGKPFGFQPAMFCSIDPGAKSVASVLYKQADIEQLVDSMKHKVFPAPVFIDEVAELPTGFMESAQLYLFKLFESPQGRSLVRRFDEIGVNPGDVPKGFNLDMCLGGSVLRITRANNRWLFDYVYPKPYPPGD